MKNQYVSSLQEGDYVNDYFVASRKDLRSRQNGGKFLGMVFRDKTGEIGGILWNNAIEVAKLFELGDVVSVRGRVNTYQQRLQVQVDQVLPLCEGDYDLKDLVQSSDRAEDDWARLRAILDTVKDPWLQKLLAAFCDDESFVKEFTGAAAAKKWHHEYRGGLLQHCYEMARVAETMAELYPEMSHDLLLVGVFTHDLGKLVEMSHDLYSDYTTEGRLLGHLQIGCDMVQGRIDGIEGFPDKLRLQIVHMILSHHGALELGSPVVPKTLEAVVLHHIDNMDAQAAAYLRIIRETRNRGQEWSDYQQLIERVIWTKGGTS